MNAGMVKLFGQYKLRSGRFSWKFNSPFRGKHDYVRSRMLMFLVRSRAWTTVCEKTTAISPANGVARYFRFLPT